MIAAATAVDDALPKATSRCALRGQAHQTLNVSPSSSMIAKDNFVPPTFNCILLSRAT